MSKITLTPEESAATHSTRNGRWLFWLLLLSGFLLLFSWLGWKAWRGYEAASSLLAREDQARQLLAAGPRDIDPAAAEALIVGLRQDVVSLRQETAFLMPLLPLAREIPQLAPLAEAAPALLEMADAGTEAAVYGFRGLKPALTVMQSNADTPLDLPALLAVIDAAKPDLARADMAMERLVAARAAITNEEELPARLRDLLPLADEWLPLAQDGLRAALVLPQMAGIDSPQRYLILAQNQDELRPTGGFISGAGLLQVENGRITSLNFQDANKIDAWDTPEGFGGGLRKPYDIAPPPIQDFMLLDLFLFRDANFWPDFRVSGQKAMDFYAYGRDVPPLDGAIAIDQEFLRLLLSGTGPITIPETGETITSANVVASLQDAWTLEDGVSDRKAFLAPFAAAIMQTMATDLGDVDAPTLARAMSQALDEKHMQVYARDPQTAAVLGANGWDGRLQPPLDHDALMVVDTNVGYNKANYFVERSLTYDVNLDGTGGAFADLVVTHRHLGPDNGEPCWQGTVDEYVAKADYTALTDKCYWNYLRVYAPEGSELISGPQHIIPGETWFGGYDWSPQTAATAELPGFTTFTSWMLLPRGAELTSEFQYQLPATITRETANGRTYTLQLYKQAGIPPHLVQVRITLPSGTNIITADPQPAARDGRTLFFNITLDKDQRLTVVYQ
jgi:hypothetical protein